MVDYSYPSRMLAFGRFMLGIHGSCVRGRNRLLGTRRRGLEGQYEGLDKDF
jgi:hypothetical protein